MPPVYRLALPALCLSLILPCAFSVEAADPAPDAAQKPAEEKPVERQPLPERSQEEATALERKIPAQEQQQLQAAQARQESADAKAADVAAAQAQIATTSASLQTATASLLQALQEEGGSTSGSLVSTSA